MIQRFKLPQDLEMPFENNVEGKALSSLYRITMQAFLNQDNYKPECSPEIMYAGNRRMPYAYHVQHAFAVTRVLDSNNIDPKFLSYVQRLALLHDWEKLKIPKPYIKSPRLFGDIDIMAFDPGDSGIPKIDFAAQTLTKLNDPALYYATLCDGIANGIGKEVKPHLLARYCVGLHNLANAVGNFPETQQSHIPDAARLIANSPELIGKIANPIQWLDEYKSTNLT